MEKVGLNCELCPDTAVERRANLLCMGTRRKIIQRRNGLDGYRMIPAEALPIKGNDTAGDGLGKVLAFKLRRTKAPLARHCAYYPISIRRTACEVVLMDGVGTANGC